MKLKIQKGTNLSTRTASQLNRILQNAFSDNDTLEIGTKATYSKDIFFILYNSKKDILSVGRLRLAKIKFLDKTYDFLGIADIVSTIKRKGYGKRIVKSMHKYLKNKKGIGFCKRKNAIFYKKSGFNLAKDVSKRFVYKNKKNKMIKNSEDDDVIYSDNAKSLIKLILSNPREKIFISRVHCKMKLNKSDK